MTLHRNRSSLLQWAALTAAVLLTPALALADPPATQPTTQPAPAATTQPTTQPSSATTQPAPPWTLPPVIVTAQKRPEELQNVPESVSAITPETIREADIKNILDASNYAPDIDISHFTNPRLSFPYIRGVGSGENSPAVTTNYDGVPQLSFRTSNIELVDIHDIEFIRGPQGTLYGRNSMGGVINVNSNPPSNKLSIDTTSTVGNYNYLDERDVINLPIIKDQLAVRIAGGITSRDGYTKNDFTGHDVDGEEAEFGKIQIWFAPTDRWDFTLRLNAERDRDGDYPLGDLAQIRAHPWHVDHGFEGNSLRDVAGTSLTINYYANYATFTSVTGFEDWRSQDITGLDYTTFNLIHEQNREHESDYTQEFRASSPKDRPIVFNDAAKLSWLAGVFLFGSDYRQNQVENFSPFLGLGFTQSNNVNALNQAGLGVFGQATLTLFDKLDLTGGVRFDAERDHADLASSTNAPSASSAAPSATFDNLSTRWGLAYHWTPELMTYATAAQGYKAGGFNATPPSPANLAFAPDKNWTYEAGVKSSWFKKKLTLNLDYFYVDWRNMQLDIPTSPSQAYVANAGKTHSQGLEMEATARPWEPLELFAGMSYTQSQFDSNIPAAGIKRGNDLPYAPDFTWNVGAQYTFKLCKAASAFIRAEEIGTGRYFYDAQNGADQNAYGMTNFRVGLKGHHWSLEGWVENAFEAHTVPLAFQYFPAFAPSGYIGENGIPRLYGVTLRIDF